MFRRNEITTASDHISDILSRTEDAKGDAEELLKETRTKVETLQNLASKADEAMGTLKELDDLLQEVENEYEDVQIVD
jgi:ABC-type transporter Mla subunit MlaD